MTGLSSSEPTGRDWGVCPCSSERCVRACVYYATAQVHMALSTALIISFLNQELSCRCLDRCALLSRSRAEPQTCTSVRGDALTPHRKDLHDRGQFKSLNAPRKSGFARHRAIVGSMKMPAAIAPASQPLPRASIRFHTNMPMATAPSTRLPTATSIAACPRTPRLRART